MFRQVIRFIVISGFLIISSCHQERIVFIAESLPSDFKYDFPNPYTEVFIDTGNDVTINGLLFKAAQSKGVVFYLHGNAGSLDTWGDIADLYLKNSYDFFIIDYRSFGKSTGKINKENDMYTDIQVVYDSLQTQFNYREKDIVVIGYSIGTGFATKLAADNNPKQLVLKAPYYSLPNLINQYYKIVPHFLVKYKLPTYSYIKRVRAPITIFHGDADKVIPIKASYKLKKWMKTSDQLVVMPGQNHNGINDNQVYIDGIRNILH